jgi:hypothetical protein
VLELFPKAQLQGLVLLGSLRMSVEVVSEVQLVVVPDEPQVDVEDLLGEAVLRVLPM